MLTANILGAGPFSKERLASVLARLRSAGPRGGATGGDWARQELRHGQRRWHGVVLAAARGCDRVSAKKGRVEVARYGRKIR